MNVPFLDLKAQHAALVDEILPLWLEILETASFIGGKHVTALEDEFAQACDVAHAVAVNSGTDALRFIFMALGLESSDEVITVPMTFISTVASILYIGAQQCQMKCSVRSRGGSKDVRGIIRRLLRRRSVRRRQLGNQRPSSGIAGRRHRARRRHVR